MWLGFTPSVYYTTASTRRLERHRLVAFEQFGAGMSHRLGRRHQSIASSFAGMGHLRLRRSLTFSFRG